MLRSKLMTGVAVLVLLVAGAGCAADLEQPPEEASTLERTVEETIAVLEQPAEETILDLEQPAEEANIFTLKGWVTVDAYHYDEATGTYVHFYHDESSNTITNLGFEWIEEQLGDTPVTTAVQWISLSSNTGTPSILWTVIPDEIVDAFGLARALGTYTDTGTGAWEISYQFTVSGGTYTAVQLTGLQYASSGDGNLFAANTFTPVDLGDGDTLTITWELTLSEV